MINDVKRGVGLQNIMVDHMPLVPNWTLSWQWDLASPNVSNSYCKSRIKEASIVIVRGINKMWLTNRILLFFINVCSFSRLI